MKKAGLGVASISPLAGPGSAKKIEKGNFVGIAYNPATLVETGKVAGQLSRGADTLKGTLRFGKDALSEPFQEIPLAFDTAESASPLYEVSQLDSPAISSEFRTFLAGKFKENGKPLQLRISSQQGGYVSGVIQRPGHDPHATAFVVGKKTATNTGTDVRGQIRNQLSSRRRRK